MKKQILLVPILAILFLLSSCEGKTGPMGPAAPLNWKSFTRNVNANQWVQAKDNNGNNIYGAYYHDLVITELDSYFMENGLCMIYYYTDYSNNNETKQPLPYIINEDNTILQKVDFDIDYDKVNHTGAIRLYYYDVDSYIPNMMKFHIVMTDDGGEY